MLALSDRITVLHLGRVIADGPPAAIQAHPEVCAAYLGGREAPRPAVEARAPAAADAGEPLLAVEGVDTFYGKSHILHAVSLEVRPGEVVALLGRNGAGKTATLSPPLPRWCAAGAGGVTRSPASRPGSACAWPITCRTTPTTGWRCSPSRASVSAVVFHHPEAKYCQAD